MQILVVDDNRLIREMVSAIIADEGYTPFTVTGAKEAHTVLDTTDIDLILMDVEMSDINGFELTRQIRQRLKEHWIPIIFLTGKTNEEHLVEGIDAGGDDYLTKPVNSTVLSAKIRAMARIAQMKAALDEANQQLLRLTHVDPLTDAINRRGMDEALDRAWRITQREKTELSLVLIDIDHFKAYNDHYGHPQGDVCLKTFSKTIQAQLFRAGDLLARYGGEEFLLILPNTPVEGAKMLCDRIIEALADVNLVHAFSATRPHVTASFGISSTLGNAKSTAQLIEQADKALYISKESGRNRFTHYLEAS
ncbi:diguanylate cyclase [Neptunomonas sp.]|uniref:GGDEF domain-containing response regulator n=1 Tax=Neptunomonas sp. TaxID=1971898 RepID=UPI00356993B8